MLEVRLTHVRQDHGFKQLADPATRAAYGAMLVMPVIIVLIVLALVWFSRTMTARGVLR